MIKYLLAFLLFLSIFGCTFGEYADKEEATSVSSDGTYYKFSKNGLKGETYYKIYKVDGNWSMNKYDFNSTSFTNTQIKNGDESQTGTYSVTSEGYLKLVDLNTTYVKAIKKDTDKIYLLWVYHTNQLNLTTPSKDTFFFYEKPKANNFISKNTSTTNTPTDTNLDKNSTNIVPILYTILF